jgi:hypothetical protein
VPLLAAQEEWSMADVYRLAKDLYIRADRGEDEEVADALAAIEERVQATNVTKATTA